MMLFRSREATNCLGILIANRHFLFIDSQLLKKNKFISNVNHQLQRQFGSLALLESLEDKKWKKQQNQYGGSDQLLLLGQKRFFADSSSSEQQQKNQIENGSTDGEQKSSRENLIHKWLRLDPACILHLNLQQGKYMKHLQLKKSSNGMSWSLNFMPEDAYQMVSAMDDLLNTLVAKHQQQEMSSLSEPSPVLLQSQRITANYYDFQLELIRLGNGSNAYTFKIKTIKTVQEHIEREMRLPIQALPWLRRTMAQILAEHDGSQQLGPAPPELPESILNARPVVQNRPPQFRDQTAQFASSSRAAGNLPTNPLSSFFKQQQQPKQQQNPASQQQQQQQLLLQLMQQQLQQLQQQQLQQQQQSLPNFTMTQPQQQYQFIPTAAYNPAALQLASQHQQLAQLRAQIAQMEAAVAATAAMSMQTNPPPPQYHHQQPQNFAGFVQQPLPQFYGQQQQFPPPLSFPFGTPFPPQQQQQQPVINNQNAAASTAAMLNQLMLMMGQLNQQQTQTAGRKTSTTNQQNASFQPKKPVNQATNQQVAGQWNRQQQPFNNSQQQTAVTGQAMMNKQPSSPPLPIPRVPKTDAGARVAATEQQNEDVIANAKLFNEIETMAEELEVEYFREEEQLEVEAMEGRAGGMEEEKAADVEMSDEEQEKKLNEKEEDDNYEERKKKKEKASLGNMFLKGKMRKTAATAGN